MTNFSLMTAVPLGAFAAAVWAVVAIRRTLRWRRFAYFSSNQKLLIWLLALAGYVPSLFVALMGAIALINIILSPGPWLGLEYVLIVTLSLGILGYLVTWGIALLVAVIVRVVSGGSASAA